jgi:hypothetical protein
MAGPIQTKRMTGNRSPLVTHGKKH